MLASMLEPPMIHFDGNQLLDRLADFRPMSIDPELFRPLKRPERVRVSAAQIHAEIYAGADADLLEPEPFDVPVPTASGRVATLLEMGFINQPGVAAFRQEMGFYTVLKESFDGDQDRYQRAQGYALRYPNYKFISDEALQRVTRKYGLLIEDTDQFIGTIPDVNVAEMARFMEQVRIADDDQVADDFSANYFIAAPPDQFKPKLRANAFDSEAAFPRWLIEDPIVLKPVKDGFLIVTVWGDEASDPDVVNERNN